MQSILLARRRIRNFTCTVRQALFAGRSNHTANERVGMPACFRTPTTPSSSTAAGTVRTCDLRVFFFSGRLPPMPRRGTRFRRYAAVRTRVSEEDEVVVAFSAGVRPDGF